MRVEGEKGKEKNLSSAYRREHSPANVLILAQWDLGWTSKLLNCKIINLFYATKLVIINSGSNKKLTI